MHHSGARQPMIISGMRSRTIKMAPIRGGVSVSMHTPREEISTVSAEHSGADDFVTWNCSGMLIRKRGAARRSDACMAYLSLGRGGDTADPVGRELNPNTTACVRGTSFCLLQVFKALTHRGKSGPQRGCLALPRLWKGAGAVSVQLFLQCRSALDPAEQVDVCLRGS